MSQRVDQQTRSALDYVRLFRSSRQLRLLWSAGIISQTGDWFHRIAIHALIVKFMAERYGSESPEALAAIGFWTMLAMMAQMFPPFFGAPIIGKLSDRFSRRALMLWSDVIRFFLAASCILLAKPELLAALIIMEALMSFVGGFFDTSQKALLPDLAEKESLLAANGIIESTWVFTTMLGATGAAVALAFLPVWFVFMLNAGTFFLSGIFVSMLRVSEEHLDNNELGEEGTAASKKGFMPVIPYILKRPPLFALLIVKPGWALVGGTILVLHTVLGGQVFDTRLPFGIEGESIGIGLLHAARGTGAFFGLFLAPFLFPFIKRRLFFVVSFIFLNYGFLYIGISKAEHVLVAATLLAMGTLFNAQLWVAPATLLQEAVPALIRGRVFAIDRGLTLFFTGASGAIAAAALAAGWAPRTIAFGSGLGLLVTGLAFGIAAIFIDSDARNLPVECELTPDEFEALS